MALVQRANPIDVDVKIKAHQNHLFSKVTLPNFVNTDNWISYDRAYGNPHQAGEVPEYFTGGLDYNEVLFNDNELMTSYYWMDNQVNVLDTGIHQVDVSLIVQAQIGEIYPNDGQRYDQTIRNQFYFNSESFFGYDSFRLNSIETGIDNVYREFIRRQISLTDMNEKHVFRLNYTVSYTPQCCTDC